MYGLLHIIYSEEELNVLIVFTIVRFRLEKIALRRLNPNARNSLEFRNLLSSHVDLPSMVGYYRSEDCSMNCPECKSPKVELVESIQPDMARYDKWMCQQCGALWCPQSRLKLIEKDKWDKY